MRIKFTLSVLLISFFSIAQNGSDVKYSGCGLIKKSLEECSIKPAQDSHSDLTKNLTGKVSGLKLQTVSPPRIRLRCGRSITSNNKPLLIIDGRILDLGKLNEVNPTDIENITIIKSEGATALYGPDGVNGIIYIITKQPKVIVKSKSGILPGASIVSTRNSSGLSTNEDGIAFMNFFSENAGREFQVSHVGYKTRNFTFYGKTDTVYLDPEITNCSEVTVTAHGSSHISCWGTFCTKLPKKTIQFPSPNEEEFSVYPSLTKAGQTITIRVNGDECNPELRIFSLDGRLLHRSTLRVIKGLNYFQVATDFRWSAGIYFVQITDPVHHKVVQQKIIFQ